MDVPFSESERKGLGNPENYAQATDKQRSIHSNSENADATTKPKTETKETEKTT